LTRLLGVDVGGQVAWLLPAAVILLGAGLALRWRAPRTDRTRAALLLWGGWLVVTAAVFSFMQGIFHPYYTVALAPAIAAVVGIGSVLLFARRHRPWAAMTLGVAVAVTALWSFILLGRSADWLPWLRPTVLVIGVLSALALAFAGWLPRALALTAAAAAVAVALAGPVAYSLNTVATPHTGAIPSAGPAVAGAQFGGGGGPGGPGGAGGPGGPGGLRNRPPVGTPGGQAGAGVPGGRGTQGGPMSGLLDARTPSAALVTRLRDNANAYTWVAATVGANNAAGYQLATGEPVMAIGGFNGSDAAPTLAQFQQYVSEHKIHFFIGGGGFRSNGGSTSSQEIATWVAQHFTAVSVGGATMYDLTSATS
jgi:4-amino-4-deoxy-L-arabinose transferase-like glycosyltransferase